MKVVYYKDYLAKLKREYNELTSLYPAYMSEYAAIPSREKKRMVELKKHISVLENWTVMDWFCSPMRIL